MLVEILNKYNILTYYKEIRDIDGKMLFCNGQIFNHFETEDEFIVLSNNDDTNNLCMINKNLPYKIIPQKYKRDKIIISNGQSQMTLFAMKT